jgi:peroxiredoxin Q/BCP
MMTARTIFSWIMLALLANLIAGVADAEQKPSVELQVGDTAPLFTSVDDQGNSWKLADHVAKKVIVLYFYPADFTTGCTRQAEAWRDNLHLLAKLDAEVVGVSADSVDNHKLFKKVWKLNFSLLSDPEANVAHLYGVPVRRGGRSRPRDMGRNPLLGPDGEPLVLDRPATFRRWTFIIGTDGKIAYKNEKVRAAKESETILEFVKSMGNLAPKHPQPNDLPEKVGFLR